MDVALRMFNIEVDFLNKLLSTRCNVDDVTIKLQLVVGSILFQKCTFACDDIPVVGSNHIMAIS